MHVNCLSEANPSSRRLDRELESKNSAAKVVVTKPRSAVSQHTHDDPLLMVLSFADDNDNEADGNGEFTSATLERENLPGSFTICSAFMVDAWTTDFWSIDVFHILKDDGKSRWGYVRLYAAPRYTEYFVKIGPADFTIQVDVLFFPLQWTRMCLSLDLSTARIRLITDGQLRLEAIYEKEKDQDRPNHLSLLLGLYPDTHEENTGKTTNLNLFSSALSVERMQRVTEAGNEDCGAPGDFLSWERAKWILHSKTKIVQVDGQTEGPCRKESKILIFMANFENHKDCMRLCQRFVGGRSPPVSTLDEWENFTREIDLATQDRSKLPILWLSATEGDINLKLGKLTHWPEHELVNNVTVKLEAQEGIWRDYYTGLRLSNWTKPYYLSKKDESRGDTYNCMTSRQNYPWNVSWMEWECESYHKACPCQFHVQPVLRLRGLCEDSVINSIFTLKQLPQDPDNMIILGSTTTRIMFNKKRNQWKLTDAKSDVTAISQSNRVSYLLGKHNWTVSNDVFECSNGQKYSTVLKLTGCKYDDFTCNNGQCIRMGQRCNQIPDCSDDSDEKNCQLLTLKDGYNKNIPPIKRSTFGGSLPANVSISIILMKVVEIDESDHSIHLQFQISLQWRENRARFNNLKIKTSLNALSDDDIQKLWLPLVIYDNTDQKVSTRLGWVNEWITRVTVTREGNGTRAGLEEVDEAEIFEGSQNNLTMTQTYTHEFQCQYKLQRYPFDTQVRMILTFFMLYIKIRNA